MCRCGERTRVGAKKCARRSLVSFEVPSPAMAHFEFAVPLCRDELQEASAEGHYTVAQVYGVYELAAKVQDCQKEHRFDGPDFILTHFDTLYSVLVNFTHLDSAVVSMAWSTQVKAMSRLTNDLSLLLDDEELDYETRTKHRNILKMITYIYCKLAELLEMKFGQVDPDAVLLPAKGRKNAKKMEGEGMDWDNQQSLAIQGLYQLLQLPLHRLWDPPVTEQAFVELVANCCYKMLENPSIAYVRVKGMRASICQTLATLVKSYNHGGVLRVKVVQLLGLFEHLVSPLSELIVTIASGFGCKEILTQVVWEISQADHRQQAQNKDQGMTRASASFLVEVARQAPNLFMPALSLLLPHLEEDSYAMRNCVLGILGEIILKALNTEDMDAGAKKSRDAFLQHLLEHMADVNSFVRSKAMQILHSLLLQDKIPLEFQKEILKIAVERIKDKANAVRKSALRLLTAFLQKNPFVVNMPIEKLEDNLKKEQEKLQQLLNAQPSKKITFRAWDSIEQDVRQAFQEIEKMGGNEADGNIGMVDGDPEAFVAIVVKYLHDDNFKNAVLLVKGFLDVFPNGPLRMVMEKLPTREEIMNNVNSGHPFTEDKVIHFIGKLYEWKMEEEASGSTTEEESLSELEDEPEEIKRQRMAVKYTRDTKQFVQEIDRALPLVADLLLWKQASDVLEAVDFFVAAMESGVLAALSGVRRMLVLIVSKEDAIRQAVINAYRVLYINKETDNDRKRTMQIVKNFINLVAGANFHELAFMEKLIVEFVKSGDLGKPCFKILWELFCQCLPNTTKEESQAALVLLGMAAGASPELVVSNIPVLVSLGLGDDKDYVQVRNTCIALLKLVPAKPNTEASKPPFKFPHDHNIFCLLKTMIIEGISSEPSQRYMNMSGKAIETIYELAEQPSKICDVIVKETFRKVHETLRRDGDTTEGYTIHFSRHLFLVGHIAVCHLCYLEVNVSGEWKRREHLRETVRNKGREDKSRNSSATPSTSVSFLNQSKSKQASEEDNNIVGAIAEDTQADFLQNILEKEILDDINLLGILRPMIVEICKNPGKYPEKRMWASANLALCKYSLVSSYFCEDNLPLLFTMLEKCPYPLIRSNIIIALRDITYRHPNLIVQWTPNMYARLRDDSILVRKNSLCILTSLILDDMIKVKGHISEIAACIINADVCIVSLAQIFFKDLAQRANALYNVMPDIISRLSNTETGVEENQFRGIMKFIIYLIQDDKQVESLVDKLCQRFKATSSERQWRDIAFCLSLFNYSTRSLRRLQDNLPCFADKLQEKQVYECILSILNAARKAGKPEIKPIVEELEQIIKDCHEKEMENAAVTQRAVLSAVKRPRPSKTPAKRASNVPFSASKRSSRKLLKAICQSSEEDFPSDDSNGSGVHPHYRHNKVLIAENGQEELSGLLPPRSKRLRSSARKTLMTKVIGDTTGRTEDLENEMPPLEDSDS